MGLDQRKTDLSAGHMQTSLGQYFLSRQKELILELVRPCSGERMLYIGNGAGNYLQMFRDKWCSVTGFASSGKTLEPARKHMGAGIAQYSGEAEDLPFSDDEFDVVVVINTLEIARVPQKVVAEAIRVCRDRVFIGFLNKYSLAGPRQRLKEICGFPLAEKIRFFSVEEIKEMTASLIDRQTIKWGSVIYFPAIVYDISTELEEFIPHMKNPLGAFVGLIFPVQYIYRVAQDPLVESYHLKANAQVTAPETVRGVLQENKRC